MHKNSALGRRGSNAHSNLDLATARKVRRAQDKLPRRGSRRSKQHHKPALLPPAAAASLQLLRQPEPYNSAYNALRTAHRIASCLGLDLDHAR